MSLKLYEIVPCAPMVLKVGLPELIKLAKETGVTVIAITNLHHMVNYYSLKQKLLQKQVWLVFHVHHTNQW